MCNPGLWNTSILHNCLACLFCPGWNLFHHSFIQHTLMPPQRGQESGKKCVNGGFPRHDWNPRNPTAEVECKAPSSIAIQHNAQLFWKRRWQWPQTLTLGEFANTCNYHGDGVPTDKTTPLGGGGGFPSLEPLEESVPTHSSSTSTKTDSWASPQVTDSEFPGREDVYQVPQVILIIRQVWKALCPHRTNNPETFRGNLSPESHRHKQIHSLIHPANICCRGWGYCE